jgi:hypothetical protein
MDRNMQSRRVNDFPELQIGYPERNDVRDPNGDMERIHVNLDSLELERTSADGQPRQKKDQNPVSGNR